MSVLDAPVPVWDTLTPAQQAEHYASALAEAQAADGEAADVERKLRLHTPPAILLRADPRG